MLKKVKVTGGFWLDRLNKNETSVHAVYNRFKDSGRFESLKCKKGSASHLFWDSDAFKWLESAAYYIARTGDKLALDYFNDAVDDIVKNQRENGYFNSHYIINELKPFQNRWDHELYTAGHLFEAAVASKQYLNDDRLLNVSKKFAKHIEQCFKIKKTAAFITPGHEEIELALYRLYKLTNDNFYRNLAEFFIKNRGNESENNDWPTITQSVNPPLEETKAMGHAVRAVYLYEAIADMALAGNKKAKKAAKAIFDDIVTSKMSVTGGIGGTHYGETFVEPYDLAVFDGAYNETCASIGFAFFAQKMFCLTHDKKYADIFERLIYNGIISGISLDGKAFFYVNPIEMRVKTVDFNDTLPDKKKLPITERARLFDCSCCPPNICRFIEQIPSFIYDYDDTKNLLYISQFITSEYKENGFAVKMESGFPYNGKVKITIETDKNVTVKIRKPWWSKQKFGGENKGYIVINTSGGTYEFDFKTELRAVYPSEFIPDCSGKLAYLYGPMVMCIEGVDNGNVFAVKAFDNPEYSVVAGEEIFKVKVQALRVKTDQLYSFNKPKLQKEEVTLIPYFAWANRGKNDMRVFIPKA